MTISSSDMKKLEVIHVSKSFGGKAVLQDVSIELNQGELVCLLGVSVRCSCEPICSLRT